jgi:hypothetical protein
MNKIEIEGESGLDQGIDWWLIEREDFCRQKADYLIKSVDTAF